MLKYLLTPLFLCYCLLSFSQTARKGKIIVVEETQGVSTTSSVEDKPTPPPPDKATKIEKVVRPSGRAKAKEPAPETVTTPVTASPADPVPAPPKVADSKKQLPAKPVRKKTDTVVKKMVTLVPESKTSVTKATDKKIKTPSPAKPLVDTITPSIQATILPQPLPEPKPPKMVRKKVVKQPGAVWVGKGDYDMVTEQDLKADPKLYLKGYTIDSFELFYIPKAKDYVLSYSVTGNKIITDRTKPVFDQLESGDKLYFKSIYASDASGKNDASLSGLSTVVEIVK